MIYIHCHNMVLKENLFALLKQMQLSQYVSQKIDNINFFIEIEMDKKNLMINSTCSSSIKIPRPFSFKTLIEHIQNLSKAFHFEFNNLIYFPTQQEIRSQDKTIKLNLIHNQILTHLLINKVDGFVKANLYKIIWPNDKEYQINKLDTHLTNLKMLIQSELDKNIIFESTNGILRIRS